jgi:transcription initiation factor TFIIIB Brf1 subunit/transcription initiation factor TFIIB
MSKVKEPIQDCEDYICDHSKIENDICQLCGLEFEDNLVDYNIKPQLDDAYNQQRPVKKEQFNYFDELAKLELPEKIASNVCKQISRLKEKTHVRVNTHLKNLFVMIYSASTEEQCELNPIEIGKKLGLEERDIRSASKIASVGIDEDGDRNPVCIISPFNFIREIAAYFENEYIINEETFQNIEEFIDLVMSHNKMLGNENPRGIATIVLKMFFDENDIIVTDFIKKTKRTSSYIKIRENMIIGTLNEIKFMREEAKREINE